MIIIERKYKTLNSTRTIQVEEVERKVFKDDDFTPIQEFINKKGEFHYVKL